MPVRRLRERARARHEAAIDEADERPQCKVLRQCQPKRKLALIDVDSLPHGVESETEQRAVRGVHDESERATPAAQEQHVRVVAAEDPLIERLLQSPDGRCEGTGGSGTDARRHTLPACPKGTPFIAPLDACRSLSANSSRWRRRIDIDQRKLAVGMAIAEHAVLWPLVAVVDRKLVTSPRAFAQATYRHALFGLVLGRLA